MHHQWICSTAKGDDRRTNSEAVARSLSWRGLRKAGVPCACGLLEFVLTPNDSGFQRGAVNEGSIVIADTLAAQRQRRPVQ